MSMDLDGEFRRNPSVAARGFTSIEAMEFVRHEFPKITSWTYWEVGHVFMGRLVDGKQWSGSMGEWRWEPVPCSYPAIFIWDSKAKQDVPHLGSKWTGVLKITGPDNIEFLLFSHLNAMGGIGNRYLISTQDPVMIEKFSEAVYAHFGPKDNKEPASAKESAELSSICEVSDLLCYNGLHILAARPGLGNTNIALMLADYQVKRRSRRVLYISIERSIEQLRACAKAIGISPGSLIDIKTIPGQHVSPNMPAVIVVDDHRRPDVDYIVAAIKKVQGVVFLDYLQLLDFGAENNLTKPDSIGCQLKRLYRAVSLYCPRILLLSHMRRPASNRLGLPPSLAQIPEISELEPLANSICALSSLREYWQEDEPPYRYKLVVLKNVNGPEITVPNL